MSTKNRKMLVQEIEITISNVNNQEFISLTDMVKGFDGSEELIKRWLQNRGTIEFLGTWEKINNPNFNLVEFHQISQQIGLNRFIMSAKKWEATGAIGLTSKAGRYGGTYAHQDIAFEFGSWLSPEFKLYLIKEFQRLKEAESSSIHIEWSAKREVAKINYKLQTDAIKQNLLEGIQETKHGYIYASEADLLNAIVFGKTAAQWKLENPTEEGNQRDHAHTLDVALMANLELLNSMYINGGFSMERRAIMLTAEATKFRASVKDTSRAKELEHIKETHLLDKK